MPATARRTAKRRPARKLDVAVLKRLLWAGVVLGLVLMLWPSPRPRGPGEREPLVWVRLSLRPGNWERVAVSFPELPWRLERAAPVSILEARVRAGRVPVYGLASYYRTRSGWSAPRRFALKAGRPLSADL